MKEHPATHLRIALAQLTVQDGRIEENVEKVVTRIEEAAQVNVDIIVFPEKFLTGYVPELIQQDVKTYTLHQNDERLKSILKACKENKIHALIGAPMMKDEKIYVSSVIVNPLGEIDTIYDKMNLYHTEISLYTEGYKLEIIQIKDWKIGLSICYDAGFPEHARLLSEEGCHLYLTSSLYSKGKGYTESRTWLPSRAMDNQIYAVMCNYTGRTGNLETCGGSAIWNPKGQIIAEAGNKEELLIVDLKEGYPS